MSLFIVFIADTGKTCFTWIGSKASKDEMRNAMSYSHVSQYYVS